VKSVPATADALVVAYCAETAPVEPPERLTVTVTVPAFGVAAYVAAENVTVSTEGTALLEAGELDGAALSGEVLELDVLELEDEPPPHAADKARSTYGKPRKKSLMNMSTSRDSEARTVFTAGLRHNCLP
jgi:hypothetical protein